MEQSQWGEFLARCTPRRFPARVLRAVDRRTKKCKVELIEQGLDYESTHSLYAPLLPLCFFRRHTYHSDHRRLTGCPGQCQSKRNAWTGRGFALKSIKPFLLGRYPRFGVATHATEICRRRWLLENFRLLYNWPSKFHAWELFKWNIGRMII